MMVLPWPSVVGESAINGRTWFESLIHFQVKPKVIRKRNWKVLMGVLFRGCFRPLVLLHHGSGYGHEPPLLSSADNLRRREPLMMLKVSETRNLKVAICVGHERDLKVVHNPKSLCTNFNLFYWMGAEFYGCPAIKRWIAFIGLCEFFHGEIAQ